MRATLGLILIVLGGLGAYFVLTGQLPPKQQATTPTGSGGQSMQSFLYQGDRLASLGGFHGR